MRRQSRVYWAVNILAPWALRVMSPWALGVGVLVSFTAVAGQDASTGWNASPLASRMSDSQERVAPASFATVATGDYADSRALLHKARLVVGGPEDIRVIPDEREPHVELKPEVKGFPEVDRTHKGDPVVSMRPTMETRALQGRNKLGLIQPAPGDGGIVSDQPVAASTPQAMPTTGGDASTTQKSVAVASPAQTASVATSTATLERVAHGATPVISRAVALSSATPAQADATPIEVSSFTGPTLALGKAENGRPDYASLVDQGKLDREKRCLAEAVYFESRSEPEAGQAAVAQVVLNRVSSGLYPGNICGVVYQNRHHYHACQFSFACEGRSLRITERESWERAVRVANEVMDGRTYISDVGRSTHYHANYVRPRWARALTKMDVIGRHIFYRLKPGQT